MYETHYWLTGMGYFLFFVANLISPITLIVGLRANNNDPTIKNHVAACKLWI